MNKNNEIEILRAVGIIFVIMAHLNGFITWNPEWLSYLYAHTYFWGGVDLFFCVSGFVITKSILGFFHEKNNTTYLNLVFAFWVRRFYRLVPAALFFITVKIVISYFIINTKYFGNFAPNILDLISQIFHISNIRYYYCVNGFSECGANPIYWSLSLEEQFYILLPIVTFFLREKVVYLLLAMIIIQFPIERPMFSIGWVFRSDAIAWGCLIAIASQSKLYQIIKPELMKNWWFRLCVTFAMLAGLSVFARGEIVPFYIGMMALPCAIMVWLSSYNEGLLFKHIRNSKTLLWVGSRSYSIYLTHTLGFYIAHHATLILNVTLSGKDTFRILFFGAIITIALSEFSFRFIESPIRNKGRLISKKIVLRGE